MQMQTLSARIPTEDLEWLVGLDLQGAVSPSDKLRALIGQLRRQHEGSLDYQRSLGWLRDLVAPFVSAIRGVRAPEPDAFGGAHAGRRRRLPQIMATLLSERALGDDAKKRGDRGRRDRGAALLPAAHRRSCGLRSRATPRATIRRCIDAHVPQVLEIVEIIAQTRRMREEKT